jgi:plasmid rolling circle replication initiator protein Rep
VPTIYLNNGLRIYINNRENGHNRPHVHVLYKDEDYSFAFDGEQLAGGKLPRKQLKEVRLYLANHQDYLNELWQSNF